MWNGWTLDMAGGKRCLDDQEHRLSGVGTLFLKPVRCWDEHRGNIVSAFLKPVRCLDDRISETGSVLGREAWEHHF